MGCVKIVKYRHSVYAMCTHKKRRIKFATGVLIDHKYWDGEKVKRSHPEHKTLNKLIQNKKDWLYRIILELQKNDVEPFPEAIKRHINQQDKLVQVDLIRSKSDAIIDEYVAYIELKSSQVGKRSLRNMKHTLAILNEFEQRNNLRLVLSSLDKFLFEQFLNFLIKVKNYKDATIDKHIRVFKTFLRWRYIDQDFSFIKYNSKISTEHNIITITWDEYVIIRDAELEGYLSKTRDLFIFLCTTGMRFSDSQRFLAQWVKSGTIEFRQLKTGGIAIVPLLEDCKNILEKHHGKPPRISSQKFNEYLKNLFTHLQLSREVNYYEFRNGRAIEKVSPLNELITSHMARKSFITLMLEKGVPVQDVMKMSGHSDFRAMRPYIAINKKHLKEVAKLW